MQKLDLEIKIICPTCANLFRDGRTAAKRFFCEERTVRRGKEWLQGGESSRRVPPCPSETGKEYPMILLNLKYFAITYRMA